jgi:hypothetical protein
MAAFMSSVIFALRLMHFLRDDEKPASPFGKAGSGFPL